MFKKILLFAAALLIIGGAAFMYFLHWMFISFEHRESHNGVGWSQFTSSLKKEVKNAGFQRTNSTIYEGSIWLNELTSGDKSITMYGSLGRRSYKDARDLNTLKYAYVNNIGGWVINCTDDLDHSLQTPIKPFDMEVEEQGTTLSSITDILDNYELIRQKVMQYEGGTYPVSDDTVSELPKWIKFTPTHSTGCMCDGNVHNIEQLTCRAEKAVMDTPNPESSATH